MFVLAYDLESFGSKSGHLESGIDTASRALPVSFELERNHEWAQKSQRTLCEWGGQQWVRRAISASRRIQCDVFCMFGQFFYIDSSGAWTPSS